jgi:uncharacterized membrane protein YtjA (UPF0391 family)
MRAYLVIFLVLLVPTVAAAFYSNGLSDLFAGAANVFFRVAPVALAVGATIGLLSHRRV